MTLANDLAHLSSGDGLADKSRDVRSALRRQQRESSQAATTTESNLPANRQTY